MYSEKLGRMAKNGILFKFCGCALGEEGLTTTTKKAYKWITWMTIFFKEQKEELSMQIADRRFDVKAVNNLKIR